MKKYILIAFSLTIITSCEKKLNEDISQQNSSEESIVVKESDDPIESSTLQTCYLGAAGKDSVFISIDDNLGTLIGKIRYKNFEKDSSFGDLIGTQNGDTLKLNYTFNSEGINSEREIFFLKKGDQLMEGIGEHTEEKNKNLYTTPSQLKYEGPALKQVDCKNFEKNFVVK